MAKLKELLDIHQNTIIKISTDRIKNLALKIARVKEENKDMKSEVKVLKENEKRVERREKTCLLQEQQRSAKVGATEYGNEGTICRIGRKAQKK